MAKTATKTAAATSTKKPATAKSQVMKIVKRMDARKVPATRAQILDEVVAKVGVSRNCAATYLQNIRSNKEGWAITA